MNAWLAAALMALLFQGNDIETRVIEYLKDNVQPGRQVVVSELANEVFKTPEERAILSSLYNKFFKIPLFLVQYMSSTEKIPTLQEIAEQFNFRVDGEADVILRIMEADPRIPRFFERNSSTGEITSINVEMIRTHPLFGREIERTIAGWEGKAIPQFSIEQYDGTTVTSQHMTGKPHLVYIWFTNCPPCVRTSPLLVELHTKYADKGFEIVAANADRVLELPYDNLVRADYVEKLGIEFTTAHLSQDMQKAYGGVSVFPTMFFVDRNGVVVKHFVNFQGKETLEDAVQTAMQK